MNWFSVFKLYNLKKMKKDKCIIFFTMLSVLITAALSVIVPIISENMKSYNEKNLKELNGGILSITSQSFSKDFLKELDGLKNEGYKVNLMEHGSAYFMTYGSSKIYSNVVLGEEGLKEDEIILSSSIAKNLSVKPGDKITVINKQAGSKSYRVKSIEGNPKAVSNDEIILGYGKVADKAKEPTMAFIDGSGDGESLKARLKQKEDGYTYSSLKDKGEEVKNSTNMKIGTLGMLTTMGYILSSVTIISTCIVLITRRKRDIAIMKLLAIKNKSIKRAISLEMFIIIGIPLVFSVILALILSPVILKLNYIDGLIGIKEEIIIALKGLVLNSLFFILFYNIPLMLLKGVKSIDIMKESDGNNIKIKKRIFVFLMLLIPVVMLLYSVYVQTIINFGTGLLLLLLILLFFIITSILMNLISRFSFKSNAVLYSFKSIKKNILSFNLVTLSLSITLTFVLLATSLNSTIKTTLINEFNNSLPYNYVVLKSENENIDDKLTKENGVEGYVKTYDEIGKITNKDINFREINLAQIKPEDYKLKYKIVEGEDLDFNDKEGVLVTSKYKEQNKLKVGDVLKALIEGKEKSLKIRGVYDGSIINTISVLAPFSDNSNDVTYFLNSKSNKWMNGIKDSPIVSIDTLGDGISQYVGQFTKLFKILSFMIILSALIFNINISYVTFLEERREENIIRALGYSKSFILKSYVIKQALIIILSSMLSYGFYGLLSKGIGLAIGTKIAWTFTQLLLSVVSASILCCITFLLPMLKTGDKVKSEMLREN